MSSAPDSVPPAACRGFHPAIPILRVAKLEASVRYYVDVLGFKTDWHYPTVASVGRDDCDLFLCEGDQGHAGAWAWIGVKDVDALHDELRARGAIIRHPPANYFWAREMQVADPDGNVLRLGSDPRPDEPLGEWLDMDGVRWAPEPDGKWRRV